MQSAPRQIVVGVAGLRPDDPRPRHPGEDPVLEPAVELAAALGATLHVVHAFTLPDAVLAACDGRHAPSRRQYAAQITRLLRGQVARHPSADRIECHAVEGSAAAVLGAFADDVGADLLMIGSSRRGQIWRGILGSTATQVLRRAHVPVLVVHGPFMAPVERALEAVDLSPAGRALHRRARRLVPSLFSGAKRFRAVHVVACDPIVPLPVPEGELTLAAQRTLREMLASVAGDLEMVVRTGEPAVELTREAEEWHADLLVLGTHDPASSRPGTLGGTAAAALRHVGCNVLVIPTRVVRRRERRSGRGAGRGSVAAAR